MSEGTLDQVDISKWGEPTNVFWYSEGPVSRPHTSLNISMILRQKHKLNKYKKIMQTN